MLHYKIKPINLPPLKEGATFEEQQARIKEINDLEAKAWREAEEAYWAGLKKEGKSLFDKPPSNELRELQGQYNQAMNEIRVYRVQIEQLQKEKFELEETYKEKLNTERAKAKKLKAEIKKLKG